MIVDQLSIDFARVARDEGIARAVDKAEREIDGWSDLALQYIKLYAAQHRGARFIGLDVRLASIKYGLIQPSNPKAWGGPLKRAATLGIIRKVGSAQDPNRHCNLVPLWEAA